MVKFRDKEISRDDVINMFKKFDLEYADYRKYDDWFNKNSYKFAVSFNEKYYPPKYILSQISNCSTREFSGGDQTNNVFRDLGFEIVDKLHLNKKIRYWKIAPGEGAEHWERCIKDNNIVVGWDEFNNLNELKDDYESFDSAYDEATKGLNKSVITKSKKQLWNFLCLNVGDIIVANKGISKVIGVGRVVGEYQYREDYSVYKHAIPVEWFDKEQRNIPMAAKEFTKKWWSITLDELTEDKYKILIGIDDKPLKGNSSINLLEKKKQIILYGPPGTGKTFSTKRLAVSVLEGENIQETIFEYENTPSPTPFAMEDNKKNDLFRSIEGKILTYPGIDVIPKKTMIGYYSESKGTNKKQGLAWISYPNAKGELKIWLRKAITEKYPEDKILLLKKYKPNGWGGYPEFVVAKDDDVQIANALLDFAYQNL